MDKGDTEMPAVLGTEQEPVSFSAVGGAVATWSKRGKDIFYPQQEVNRDSIIKLRGGMHPCFPNFGPVDKKFGLPQHGPLRTMNGVVTSVGGATFVARFEGSELSGNSLQPVRVEVRLKKSKKGGFEYSLEGILGSDATQDVFVSPGLHPYFATPNRTARVFVGNSAEVEVSGLMLESKTFPLNGQSHVLVTIPGVGAVRMELGDAFLTSPNASVVVWRDSLDYVCVEPIIAPPNLYGTENCPRLRHNRTPSSIKISCKFTHT